MNIGRNITKIRKKRKITRRELAKKASVPYQTLNNIEAGRVKEPGIAALIKIARVLDVSLDILILGIAGKGLRVTIPSDVCCTLHDPEVKKFFSLVESIDVKNIKNLKKVAKYFQKIIDSIEAKR